MPQFSYVARDASGQRVTGSIEAVTQQEVLTVLANRSLFPVEVDKGKKEEALFVRRRVPRQLLATTLGQLADLIQSGVPLLKSLEIIKRQATHAGLREVFVDLHHQVEDGSTLAEAMRRHERTFGNMAVSVVHAGSEGGFLEESLSRVSTFIELQEDIKSRTIGGIAYPALLAVFGTGVITALMIFCVPMFDQMFAGLERQGQLPALTKGLIAISNFVQAYLHWIIAVAVAAGVLVWRWRATDAGRYWVDLAKLRLPLAGPIIRNLALARFCRTLGTMLNHGVPIIHALKISSQAASNVVLAEAVVAATENISAGETLAQPLSQCKHFPETIVEMIAVAEESNRLNDVLVDIAESLERRTFRRLDLAVRLLEPIMLIIMAGIVLCVVIALLLPMFRMGLNVQ